MNFDDILGKLMPLFEQKMAFNMEMSKRAMSLEEKKEANKADLEYRRLESQITNEKDKLKWEKEKLTTAVKADSDLQVLKNSGMLDMERLKQIGEKDKQKIMEEGANSRAKLNADTETNKAYLTTLGTILGHAQEISQTGLDGQTKTSKPTAAVGDAARSLMEQTGLARPSATPQSQTRNVAGEAEFAADVLRQHEKAGTPEQARSYLNTLPADTRQAALALLNPGRSVMPTATQANTVADEARPAITSPSPAPITAAPPGQPQPAINAAERPTITPTGDNRGQPYLLKPERIKNFFMRPDTGQPVPSVTATTPAKFDAMPSSIGRGTGIVAVDPEDQKKRQETLRRARGLTVGGF